MVQILSETTVSDDDEILQEWLSILSRMACAQSSRITLWGRVRSSVIFAFTSKYSLALYELISARINLKHMWQEEFGVDDLRSLLGVPDGKLSVPLTCSKRSSHQLFLRLMGLLISV